MAEKLSYLIPRPHSINSWGDRVRLPIEGKRNLFGEDFEEDSATATDEKLKVYLRIKPYESENKLYTVTDTTLEAEAPKDSYASKNISKIAGKLIHRFQFSSILDQDASQERVFKECVVENLRRFVSGENFTVFAYGTTNAGKTFTMQGTTKQPGIIPRSVRFVFDALGDKTKASCRYQPAGHNDVQYLSDEEHAKLTSHKNFILGLDLGKYQRRWDGSLKAWKNDSCDNSSSSFRDVEDNAEKMLRCESGECRYSMWISMIEVYNEQVYDLLDVPDGRGGRPKLAMAEDEYGNVFIKNLRLVNVATGDEAFKLFEFGRANLQLAPTLLNSNSSRSHCIFSLTLAKFSSEDTVALSKFSFCDLAGTERAKKTLNTGNRLAEAKSINTSLLILTRCLTIIKENQTSKEKKIVPYRESKLTRLFRNAMLGRERLSIVVNITPEGRLFQETLNVLKFSAVAQQIVPVRNYKAKKRIVGRTRFSRVVANVDNARKIIWDAGTVVDVKEDDSLAFEELLRLVEKLKEELQKERQRAQGIEIQVRRQLTEEFSKIINQQHEFNVSRFEKETQRMKDAFVAKERQLVERYERRIAGAKRRRVDDECHADPESEIEKLRIENEFLASENVALQARIKAVTADNGNLKIRCSRMEFDLSDRTRRLRASESGGELERGGELLDARRRIEELKKLLDESAVEYKDLLETNKSLKETTEAALSELASKADEAERLRSELDACEKVLAVKSRALEEMERKVEEMEEARRAGKPEGEELNETERLLRKCELEPKPEE